MEKTRFPPLSARRGGEAVQKPGTTLEELAGQIVNAMPKLGHEEQRVAVALYRLLAQGEPVSPTSLARAVNLSETYIRDLLTRWPGVYHDDSGSVIGFWGLALPEMPHRFTVERRTLHTWCAWDSLFIPGIIGKTAHVESADPLTKVLMTLSVGPDGVNDASSAGVVVSFLSPEGAFDADVIMNFCHFVHFFDSEESGARWTATHKGTFLLSLEEAFTLGQMTNARKFQGAL